MGLRGGTVVRRRKDETRVTKEVWREEESMVTKVAIRLTTRVANRSNGKGRTRLGGRFQRAIVFRVNSVYNDERVGGTRSE